MNLNLIGFTFDVIGKVLLGVAVLLAHRRIMEEHKIDKKVLIELRREQILGVIGVILIIIGYFLQLPYKV